MKKPALIFAALAISGCSIEPTKEDIARADYGPPVSAASAEEAARAFMQGKLKDPYSTVWVCDTTEPQKKNIGILGSTVYGWSFTCKINSKNSFGAYVGEHYFQFIINNGKVLRAVESKERDGFPENVYNE